MMGKGNFSDDFERDAVAQITERGYPVAEVSGKLGAIQKGKVGSHAVCLCIFEENACQHI